MPELSISIPTYKRIKLLKQTLDSIEYTSRLNSDDLKCLINIFIYANECSSEEKTEILSWNYSKFNLILCPESKNIGMISNIKRCLMNTSSTYNWILSDHMIIKRCIYDIQKYLCNHNPDYLIANITSYPNLPARYFKRSEFSQLNNVDFNKFLFCWSNISTNIYRSCLPSLQYNLAKDDEILYSSYPHLIILKDSIPQSTFCVISGCSSFIGKSNKTAQYNRLDARFIEYPVISKKVLDQSYSYINFPFFCPPLRYVSTFSMQLYLSQQVKPLSIKKMLLLIKSNGLFVSFVVFFVYIYQSCRRIFQADSTAT